MAFKLGSSKEETVSGLRLHSLRRTLQNIDDKGSVGWLWITDGLIPELFEQFTWSEVVKILSTKWQAAPT